MKITLYEQNPEYVDSDIYLDFDGYENVIIDGNDHFVSLHTDYSIYKDIKEYCINTDSIIDTINDLKNSVFKNASEVLEYYLFRHFSTMQVHKIVNALNTIYNDDDLVVELLSICERKKWTYKTIRGCCQGEWNTIFYPIDEYSDDFIDYIESVYFNTGSEFSITDSDDPENVIYDYFSDSVTYDIDKLKREVIKRFYNKASIDDIAVYTIDGYSRQPIYKEH